jgi:hypothetical protein
MIDEPIDDPGLDLRLIALHVNDDVIAEIPRHLRDPIRPALMRRRGHDAVRLKRPQGIDDPLIVGGNDGFAHQFALAHLIDHVLDERFTGAGGDNFGGEAGRPVSGGNDNGCSQESILISRSFGRFKTAGRI